MTEPNSLKSVLEQLAEADRQRAEPQLTSKQRRARTVARLAAVQALYQMELAGEGVETLLSVQSVLPAVAHVAALSGAHLAALILPPDLRHLYIARDADPAGERGAATLRQRAEAAGILVSDLDPREDDFNTDLCHLGPRDLALLLAPQLDPNDAVAYLRFEEALAA